MSTSPGAASLRSHLPSASSLSQGAVHDDEQENIAIGVLQRLLQHDFRDQNEGTMHESGQLTSDDEVPRPASTETSWSPNLSTISFDSLEESPTHDVDQSPAVAKPASQHKPRVCRWLPNSIWKMEILSCMIASLCLAAIVGILSMYKGLPASQWPHIIILNALISVFTAIFKMSLIIPIAEGKKAQIKAIAFGCN